MVSLEEVLAEIQKNNRVCPQPKSWQQLYDMLPHKRHTGGGWEPSLPLILAAWWDTPSLSKKLRFHEHIKWAADHGCLKEVYVFLQNIPEDQWHHLGE